MISPFNGKTQSYVDNLDRIQSRLDTVQRQISSGVRVELPSDDPTAVPPILRDQAGIAMDQQLQTNLGLVKAQLGAGDTALQNAAKLLDQAVSMGTQAANSTVGPTEYATLAEQAKSIRDSLVGVASTAVNGRYLFSGDYDSQPPYQPDDTQPNLVRQIAPAASTRVIADRNGAVIWRPITAADIFDSGDASTGNVFGAVASLVTALEGKDPAAAQTAVANLKTASDHLNQKLGLHGIAETRLAEALQESSSAETAQKADLGSLRDTDVAAAALDLSQGSLQQQSALAIGPRLAQKSLFDYLA